MVAKIARFLAPIALAAVGVGVYLIVHSTLVHHPTTVSSTGTSTVANGATHTPHKHRPGPKFYIVKSGDTLGRISARVHVPVSVLTTLNASLSGNPNSLQTGQRLRLRR
jgi:LysM repeat protein